jgi:excisionase family DNA binding protein
MAMTPQIERAREILTPEQAAEELQVNRETIYRFIRQGKLMASRLGRTYRIPRGSLDALLWSTRTRPDIQLRDFTANELTEFLKEDELTGEAASIAAQARTVMEQAASRKP